MRRTIPTGLTTGVLATLGMDLAMVLASGIAPRLFATDQVGLGLTGRWAAGLLRGRLSHGDVGSDCPVRGEVAVGAAAHYLAGTALTSSRDGAGSRSCRIVCSPSVFTQYQV
jgi:hypothetical protein